MRSKTIQIPIYAGKLVIIQDKNWKKVNKKYDLNVAVRFGAFVFRTEKDGYVKYIACFDKDPVNHLIAHECVHLVNYLFEDWGIKLDTSNDEPQAYLLSWFFKEIEQFLKFKK